MSEPSVTGEAGEVAGAAYRWLTVARIENGPATTSVAVTSGAWRAVAVQAVGRHATGHARQHRPKMRVVGARHDGSVERHLVRELDERLLQVRKSRCSFRDARGRCS